MTISICPMFAKRVRLIQTLTAIFRCFKQTDQSRLILWSVRCYQDSVVRYCYTANNIIFNCRSQRRRGFLSKFTLSKMSRLRRRESYKADGPHILDNKNFDFTSEVPLDYKCPLCHNLLRDPIQLISCGHRFCNSCYLKNLG